MKRTKTMERHGKVVSESGDEDKPVPVPEYSANVETDEENTPVCNVICLR